MDICSGDCKLHIHLPINQLPTPSFRPSLTMPSFEVVKANACALPQYSQAVIFDGAVYCSGDIGAVPGTNWELRAGTTKDRAVSNLANSTAALFGGLFI